MKNSLLQKRKLQFGQEYHTNSQLAKHQFNFNIGSVDQLKSQNIIHIHDVNIVENVAQNKLSLATEPSK